MPFKLFHIHKKDKKDKLKVRVKSTNDLSSIHEPPDDQSPDSVFVSPPTQLQFRSKSSLHLFPLSKSKSTLHLFAASKTMSHFSFPDEKENEERDVKKKQRMSVHVMESHQKNSSTPSFLTENKAANGVINKLKLRGSMTGLNERCESKNNINSELSSKDHMTSGHLTKNHSLDRINKSHNHLSTNHLHPNQNSHHPNSLTLPVGHNTFGDFYSKSASCSSFSDSYNRDRRLLEIAQLDNYIDYLRRSADDGIHTASRLCCAQVLKLSFMRLERRYVSDVLHSNSPPDDRLDSCFMSPKNGYSSPKNGYSTSPKTAHFERRMTSFRRRPPYLQNLKSRQSEWSQSGEDADDEKSGSRLLDGSGDEEPSEFQLGSSEELAGKSKMSDYDSDSGSDGELSSRRSRLKKRKSVPVFPVEIDIY